MKITEHAEFGESTEPMIKIDGEWYVVDRVNSYGYTTLGLDDGTDWYIFESSEVAGEVTKEYWRDMAESDPREFTAIVGEKTLIAWGLGQLAGPGYVHVRSLQDWIELTGDYPEEQWASYDGTEVEPEECNEALATELGFDDIANVVIYRHN
jgi:hypothetical protein